MQVSHIDKKMVEQSSTVPYSIYNREYLPPSWSLTLSTPGQVSFSLLGINTDLWSPGDCGLWPLIGQYCSQDLNTSLSLVNSCQVTVGYGYELDMAPDWYREAWEASDFGQQGVAYKDWLDCTVKHPLALNWYQHCVCYQLITIAHVIDISSRQ